MAKRSQPGRRDSKSTGGRRSDNSGSRSGKSSGSGRGERPSSKSGGRKETTGRPAGRPSRFSDKDESRFTGKSSGRSTSRFGKDEPRSTGKPSRFAGKDEPRSTGKSSRFSGKDEPRSAGKSSRFAGKNESRSAGKSSGFSGKDESRSSGKNESSSYRGTARNSDSRSGGRNDSRSGGNSERRFSDKKSPHFSDKKRSDSSSERPYSSKKTGSFGSKKSYSDDPKSPREGARPSSGSGFRKSVTSYDRPTKGAPRGKGAKSTPENFQGHAPVQTEKIRLNRYIANSGVCSRREADELITMGLISVNGKTITELGYKVNPGDEVRYESKVLKAEKPVYILLNKPKGYLTTTSDPQERNTVMHLIGDKIRERIYPVGRLDRNTTGLLLLTNDGDLADKLMHPSYNVKKIYKVELDRPLSKGDFQKIMEGVRLEEGVAQVDDLAIISEDNKTVGIELHIGWNRVVRRIFESLEYQVVKLDRSVYAGLDKKELSRGQWRYLRQEEIVRLKHYK